VLARRDDRAPGTLPVSGAGGTRGEAG
jgi:hypothetical protein